MKSKLPPFLALLLVLSIVSPARRASAQTFYAVTTSNTLLRFDGAMPGTIAQATPITGLQAAEQVLGIDYRPATGAIFALGSNSRLYALNTSTGAATLVGSGGGFTLSGTEFGSDFNPVVDRLRVVSDADQNMRLNPDTGGLAGTDTLLAFGPGDPNTGANPSVVGSAYTNNVAGALSTTLYAIDAGLDVLAIQNPPNAGTLNTVGGLGVDTSGSVGFEIRPDGTAWASFTVAGTSGLYTMNLATGAATLVGTIGGGQTVRDITTPVDLESFTIE